MAGVEIHSTVQSQWHHNKTDKIFSLKFSTWDHVKIKTSILESLTTQWLLKEGTCNNQTRLWDSNQQLSISSIIQHRFIFAQVTCLPRVGKGWTQASSLIAALSPQLQCDWKKMPGDITPALPFFIWVKHFSSCHFPSSYTHLTAQAGKNNLCAQKKWTRYWCALVKYTAEREVLL